MTMLSADPYVPSCAADPVLEDKTVTRLVRTCVRSEAAVAAIDELGGEARPFMVDVARAASLP